MSNKVKHPSDDPSLRRAWQMTGVALGSLALGVSMSAFGSASGKSPVRAPKPIAPLVNPYGHHGMTKPAVEQHINDPVQVGSVEGLRSARVQVSVAATHDEVPQTFIGEAVNPVIDLSTNDAYTNISNLVAQQYPNGISKGARITLPAGIVGDSKLPNSQNPANTSYFIPGTPTS